MKHELGKFQVRAYSHSEEDNEEVLVAIHEVFWRQLKRRAVIRQRKELLSFPTTEVYINNE